MPHPKTSPGTPPTASDHHDHPALRLVTRKGSLATAEPVAIRNELQGSVKPTLRQIHEKAPNAHIVLMGYPLLLTGYECTLAVTPDEVAWISEMGLYMRDQERLAVADLRTVEGIPVWFADPVDNFAGRGACSGADYAIHDEVLELTSSDQGPASAESFHPNIAGYVLYATTLQQTLDAMGV